MFGTPDNLIQDLIENIQRKLFAQHMSSKSDVCPTSLDKQLQHIHMQKY